MALLVGSVILTMLGGLQGCADQPRIKYNLTVENLTPIELANVRVSIDHTSSGAKFGFLVPKAQSTFGLFNTAVHEGYLLRYQREGVTGEWSSWLPFKTDELPNGWDGEIRLVIDQGVVRLQIEPQNGAKKVVTQGTISTGANGAREDAR